MQIDGTLSVKAYGGPTGTQDEIQQIDIDDAGGSFTIDLDNFGLGTTAAIPADATPTEVQAALEEVDGVPVGDRTRWRPGQRRRWRLPLTWALTRLAGEI